MRIACAVTAAIGALVVALTLTAPQPAVAGLACDELDLRSPCIGSNDIRANIVLGGATGDVRLRLRNEAGANVVDLRASDGNLINRFSNNQEESNGLVKAWARINPDGTVAACWRRNTDPAETQALDPGTFEVDFTPLATDIRGRPRSATIDGGGQAALAGFIVIEDRTGDSSSVFVATTNSNDVDTA
jgi:hypothetical protein